MHWGYYIAIRVLLWLVAVIVALFPTLMSAPESFSFNIVGSLGALNTAGLFRDLFFIIIPAAALALSTLIDYLCMCRMKMSGAAFALSIIALIVNTAALR